MLHRLRPVAASARPSCQRARQAMRGAAEPAACRHGSEQDDQDHEDRYGKRRPVRYRRQCGPSCPLRRRGRAGKRRDCFLFLFVDFLARLQPPGAPARARAEVMSFLGQLDGHVFVLAEPFVAHPKPTRAPLIPPSSAATRACAGAGSLGGAPGRSRSWIRSGWAGAVTSADATDHGALGRLRLPCLAPFYRVRFTNRFT